MKTSRPYRSMMLSVLAAAVAVGGVTQQAEARNKPCKRVKHANENVLRTSKLFDVQQNSQSNVEFFTTNYGVLALNVESNVGGMFWPRDSRNLYGFSGGLWVAAKKEGANNEMNKLVFITHNPNSGNSWAVPGRRADGDAMQTTQEAQRNYRVYSSVDYTQEGTPKEGGNGTNWPIWHTQANQTPGSNGYAGDYVANPAERTMSMYPKGPVVLSDEDIFTIYKDSDLNQYEGGIGSLQERGYPLGVDIAQTIYTWGTGELKDAVVVHYEIVNRSSDVLRECWIAPAVDFDLASPTSYQSGAANDRTRYYHEDPTLDLAVQWTETDRGEADRGFGYVGMSFLSSPAVDDMDNIRHDQPFYPRSEQIGLTTFRNWVIENDPTDDGARYDFVSLSARDGDAGPGDKRFLMATGPFTLKPGEKAKVAVAFVFAMPAAGTEATGNTEDLANVVALTKKVREKYEESMAEGVITHAGDDASAGNKVAITQVYPNPASAQTRVEFTVPTAGMVTADIVDVMGRVVHSLQQRAEAGRQVLSFDASLLSAGTYYCRITSNGATATTMLSVVR